MKIWIISFVLSGKVAQNGTKHMHLLTLYYLREDFNPYAAGG